MGRAPRVGYPGAVYHAMSRGVNRRPTFRDDRDRLLFLSLLGGLVLKGSLLVHAICLMVDHFHLLVETPRAQLGRWMQSLLGDYARLYNLRHKRVGHLWQGR